MRMLNTPEMRKNVLLAGITIMSIFTGSQIGLAATRWKVKKREDRYFSLIREARLRNKRLLQDKRAN